MRLSDFAPDRFPGGTPGHPAFPELLVCAAVNVSDRGTTPPGRASLPFVFSPTSVGHPDKVVVASPSPWWRRLLYPARSVGETVPYGPLQMDTATYERRMSARRARDVTLSAAVAISGAAIAPSMGKMTRAPFRFLLALANVRLGVWLPNPANMPAGCTVGDGGMVPPPNPRQVRLLYEVAGRHRVRSKFLYVTDGGHTEPGAAAAAARCTTTGLDTRVRRHASRAGRALRLWRSRADGPSHDRTSGPARTAYACDHYDRHHPYPTLHHRRPLLLKALFTSGLPGDLRLRPKDCLFPAPHRSALRETFDATCARPVRGRRVRLPCGGRAPSSATGATGRRRPSHPHPVR